MPARKRNYLERDFQAEFSRWLRGRGMTAAFELKVSRGTSLPFSDLAEHQREALEAASGSGFAFKIPDLGNQNPFDCFALAGVLACVAVMFRCQETGQREFFLISVREWEAERSASPRKSLTEKRAREIGTAHFLS